MIKSIKINVTCGILQFSARSKSKSRSIDSSSRILTWEMQLILEKLKCNQTRSSTAKNYHTIWMHFNKFLRFLDSKQEFFSWEECTALFGAYLVKKGNQSATIKSYFSAIKHVLKTDGYPWNDDKVVLASII